MNICLFEDNLVQALAPITLCRPAYAITCGGVRLLDFAKRLAKESGGTLVGGHVRTHLAKFEQDYFPQTDLDPSHPTLWLNARLVPDARLFETLQQLAPKTDDFKCLIGNSVALARTAAGKTEPALVAAAPTSDFDSTVDPIENTLRELDLPQIADFESKTARLFELPYQVIAEHANVTAENLRWRLDNSPDYQEEADNVFVRGKVSIHPMSVFDTTNGPIILEDGVQVGPFAVLNGPIYLSENTKVNPHSLLKGPISVGHTCKVGGEVSASIIESYTNKSHFGYLGTSYVGSWVNLGAGTTNSNLKNTYGTIRLECDSRAGEKVDTGLQFLGCVIGDYTKTAIHTSIYTGKTIGVCSNVYGTVTKNVPSFANYAQSFGEVTEQSAEVMLTTQKRVFDRRNLVQEDRHRDLIQAIYELEAPKRSLPNRPLSL